MDELFFVYATAVVILLYLFQSILTRRFDPFAPIWLFLVGYSQVYIIQALSYHDWAVASRGEELVTAANFRAFWALVWFLAVYHLGIGRRLAPVLPQPPRGWSSGFVAVLSVPLIVWGLFCAGVVIRGSDQGMDTMSAEESLFRSFPFVMIVAAILLIVTGRRVLAPRPVFLAAGLVVASAYVAIWMFNGKRSHSLIGVLASVCAFYISRQKRPSWPVLLATSFTGVLVVAIAIGWRGNFDYERSAAGFMQYLSEFKASRLLENLNILDHDQTDERETTHETEEYGGFLLMEDTVPAKSGYDYGRNYLRIFTTFIPRILWPDKPLLGREQWIAAWMAGSELDRSEDFTSPSIGILGATQLNGGAVGTLIVLGCLATMWRLCYEYFRLHAAVPWVQFWWAIFFYNAWFMVVADDPMVWFYYNWGFSTFPIVVLMWIATKFAAPCPDQDQLSDKPGLSASHESASGHGSLHVLMP